MTNKNYDDFISGISEAINKDISSEKERNRLQEKLLQLRKEKANIMIVGGTGVGKSSTINALFDTTDAKVGVGVDPETMSIDRYEFGNVILWDTPGLGHGVSEDERHKRNIIAKLNETDDSGSHHLIDLVLVVVDSSNRDMGTSYELIDLIIRNYSDKKRIIIGLNQCDMAMKGRFWNYKDNRPEPQLVDFLEKKVESIKRRISESNHIDIEPIYYSAGYTDGCEKQYPYNISKLYFLIIKNLKDTKALVVSHKKSTQAENFMRHDGMMDYEEESEGILKRAASTVFEKICEAASFVKDTVSSVFSSVGNFFSGWF